jgi:hypothetical protein
LAEAEGAEAAAAAGLSARAADESSPRAKAANRILIVMAPETKIDFLLIIMHHIIKFLGAEIICTNIYVHFLRNCNRTVRFTS